MELQLKNIGMIKEATVKLDGLTVIAGENDTGKKFQPGKIFIYYITKVPPFQTRTLIFKFHPLSSKYI